MAVKINQKDWKILTSLAEYRMLLVYHLAALDRRNIQSLRRRLCYLETEGLVCITARDFGKNRGRPEQRISLAVKGVDMLKSEGFLDADISAEFVTAEKIRCIDHHMLMNDLRIQLVQIQRIASQLSVRFLTTTSPTEQVASGSRPLIHEKIQTFNKPSRWVGFTPDGVFSISQPAVNKTLLFFLEVDMGTETLVRAGMSGYDVRQKIINYKIYFVREQYKRYEQIWNCQLHGFRLLFLTHSRARSDVMCKLVREMSPSGFIWLTDRKRLLSGGIWANIWAGGGQNNLPLQSILGNQAPDPTPKPSAQL